ncbi:gas vesicle protein [Sporomusaceae bacterium BoRhaA]|uniref:hypothetical protein n=1 Tax=Pelorhabdus rhamnosifermentans TaxID=2772457 RepID=UPI001C0625B9|nr:hypothetical protein [Pelorhabdus rhamnosifermentans]MBU2700083.1 gas vesicle protein [Pelorhabdus rhamnosifermentans]
MNIMRLGSRIFESSPPVALVATGAAIAIAFPPFRRGLRTAAVLTTRGALALTDGVKQLGNQIKDSTADIVAEARNFDNTPQETFSETIDCVKDTAKKHGRRVAVATAAGALTLSDKVKSLRKDFKEVVEEAKTGLADNMNENNAEIHVTESQPDDVPEVSGESSQEITDTDSEDEDIPRRRRISRKKTIE